MPDSHAPHSTPFKLQTLGGLSLVDRADATVGQQRRRLALLALVANSRERGVSRDRLVSLLSPESPTESARHSLEQLIYYLRRSIGEEVFLGTDPLRLNPTLVSCDALEFESALEKGQLQAAVAFYKGPFLDGFHLNLVEFEEWVSSERARLARLYSEAIQRLAVDSDRSGNRDAAVRWWRTLAVLDPLSGVAALGLMRALAAAGDLSAALRHAQTHKTLLQSELGSPPSAELSALAAALAAGTHPTFPQSGAQSAADFVHASGPEEAPDPGETSALSQVAVSAGASATTSRLRRAGHLLAVVGLASVALVAAAMLLKLRTEDSRVSPGLVAVLPFSVTAEDSTMAWMGEGLMELLNIRLAGEGGMRLVEPRRTMEVLRDRREQGRGSTAHLAQLAAATSAVHAIEGVVTGSARHIVLSSTIVSLPEGVVTARASAEGPPDSLPALVDRLSAQLLGIGAGLEGFRLAAVASASIPAVRAYLEGRAAFRSGRLEAAFTSFRTSVELDSTFALGGLALARTASYTGSMEAWNRGRAIAIARQDLLSPADRALLGVTKIFWDSASDVFDSWSAAVAAFPEVPEMWYGLGNAYYRWGALAGLEGFLERAEDAFNRGWILDSLVSGGKGHGTTLLRTSPFFVEPLRSMIELAHMRGDVARVRQLAALGLSVDSASDVAVTLRWHRAMGDRAAKAAFWKGLPAGDYLKIGPILMFTTWTGLEPEDHPRAITESVRRLRMHDPWGILPTVRRSTWLNSGRPRDAGSVLDPRYVMPRVGLRYRVFNALSWGGEVGIAREAVARLEELPMDSAATGTVLAAQMTDVCTLGRWRAAHNDLEGARVAARRLRVADLSSVAGEDSLRAVRRSALCASILDAIVAVESRAGDAPGKLSIADSLARTWIFQVCCSETIQDVNLVLGRLWEKQGDTLRALQAVRRGGGRFMDFPAFLSSFLIEEGRLAAVTGDTTGAIRAYRHYLSHRFDPESAAREESEHVKRELLSLNRTR